MIKVIYNKVCGRCVQSEPLTSGMVGQPIHFEYSHDFDGLAATAVFTDGKNTVDVVNPGNECIIPHEVLTTVGAIVKVGIYAVKGDKLVIPTIYAHIGIVLKGADPSGDVSIDPTLPVWAQTQALIGNLSQIETETKDSLVAAINEVKQTADRKANAADLAPVATSGSYSDLTDKPAIPDAVTEGTVSGWGFTKNTGTYSKPTGGIPKADLANDVQASLGKAETALQEHQSLAAYRTAAEQSIIDNSKQDKLIAGENITIAEDGKTISATGGGGSVPKPLTYDYMPEGYPKKEQSETVIVENQTISGFQENTSLGVYIASNSVMQEAILNKYPENIPTIKILWDGTEYECQYIHAAAPVNLAYGNTSLLGVGEDTGEPFLIPIGEPLVISKTAGDSHEIKASAVTETITPMSAEFLPTNMKNTTVFYL